MILYFYGNSRSPYSEKSVIIELFNSLRLKKHFIANTLEQDGLEAFSKRFSPPSVPKGKLPMDFVDAFILLPNENSEESECIIDYALSKNRPILYLYKQSSSQDKNKELLAWKKLQHYRAIQLTEYDFSLLAPIIENFLDFVNKGAGLQRSVKFTVRLPQAISEKLTESSARCGMKKADMVRTVLSQFLT